MPNSKAATCLDVCGVSLPGGTFVRFVADKTEHTKYFRGMDFVDVVTARSCADTKVKVKVQEKDTTLITCAIGMTPYWKKCLDGNMRLVFDIEGTSITPFMRSCADECPDFNYGPTKE